MERRIFLAVLLMTAVILVTNILFPPVPAEPEAEVDAAAETVEQSQPAAAALPTLEPAPAGATADAAPLDTVEVVSPLYRYAFVTRGAALAAAELTQYESYTEEGVVQLVPEGAGRFLTHRLAVGADTVDLARLPFQASERRVRLAGGDEPAEVAFRYAGEGGFAVELVYTFHPDRYLIGIRGRVQGLGGRPATLLTELGPGLQLHEAQGHQAQRELAVATRTADGDIDRLSFDDVAGAQLLTEPMTWVGLKDKYFLAALIAGDQTPFTAAALQRVQDTELLYPGADEPVVVARATAAAALPVGADGSFAMDAYLGPQDYGRLKAAGQELEEVTPYSYRWLQPIIRPFVAAVIWVLGALHETLGLAYGWVLVLFGVLMRVVMWPLNAKAMRAQIKNMAVQPLMQEVREKYKDNPQKQQEEMMKLIKEHGFNPLSGCLPLLVPFPVLITLFFVFQNTIVFRGVEFLWIPDLSLQDPLLILPVFLVVSMFLLQKISLAASGGDQNPQARMMMYFMPVMMGVLFFNLPAGLNLYYATTNVASVPQQMLIARERRLEKERIEEEQTKPNRPGKRKPAKKK